MNGEPDQTLATGAEPARQAALPPPESRAIMLAGLTAAVLSLVLFAWLAEEVFQGHAEHFDTAVRGWAHRIASPGLTAAMRFASSVGGGGVEAGVVLSIVVFLLLRWKRAAVWMAVTMAGALVLDLTLKTAYHRPRPEPFFGAAPHSYSFPSGHSLFSFCFYGVLAGLVTARIRSHGFRAVLWSAAAVMVATIGFSRIYLGVHYPSDVLGGYLSAAMWVGAIVGADRFRRRRGLRRRMGGKN